MRESARTWRVSCLGVESEGGKEGRGGREGHEEPNPGGSGRVGRVVARTIALKPPTSPIVLAADARSSNAVNFGRSTSMSAVCLTRIGFRSGNAVLKRV